MENISTRTTAVVISLLIAIVSGLIIYANFSSGVEQPYVVMVFSSLLVFLISFVSFFFVFNNIIVSEIKQIYKTIDTVKTDNTGELFDNMESSEIFSKINKEVVDWGVKKSKEIKQLKANDAFRKEFLGNVYHELKTPIFNVQGYVSTLIDGGLNDNTINLKYLKRANKNINRLISVVDDLETISQLEAGDIKLYFSSFNLVETIYDVLDMHEIKAGKRKITLKFAYDRTESILVYADKQKIFEVISNLVVNSIKYGKEKGYTEIRLRHEDDLAIIDIIDNGIGISEGDLPRVFERFYRVDKSRSREICGTGLGLSIVKHIIEAHQQEISVKSQVNEGSIFSFSLKASKYVE